MQRTNGRFLGAQVGIRNGQDRYTMTLVVAHELGHVLGLDHEDRFCATMNSYLVDGHPEYCLAAPAGKWICRLLRADDVRGEALPSGHYVNEEAPEQMLEWFLRFFEV